MNIVNKVLPKQFLTGIFKIHNPSTHKRQVMDFALCEYSRAYQWLLDIAQNNLNLLQAEGQYNGKFSAKAISSLLPPQTKFRQYALHSSIKNSLLTDVAGNLASYFALLDRGEDASFPTARDPSPYTYPNALDTFSLVGTDIMDYEQSKNRLLASDRGNVMPVYFAGADGVSGNRYFSLLWDMQDERPLAILYLLPNGHSLGKLIRADRKNLIRIDTGEIFRSTSKCAILVPLEMGRNGWQFERFLSPSVTGDAQVKSAYLMRNDETTEYYLHISFALNCPQRYEPQTYLGIDKGILISAAYSIVDGEGNVVYQGLLDDNLRELQIKHGKEREQLSHQGKKITFRHYKRRAYDNILHCLANEIIELALQHQAQIVLEKLDIQVQGKRVISRFRKLDKIIEYKSRLAGVPYRHVFPAYSSVICPACGEDMRRDDRLVYCTHCGYTGHSDLAASINIARRALYHKDEWADDGGYRAFHRSFANPSTFIA